jgi:hypothetical protein
MPDPSAWFLVKQHDETRNCPGGRPRHAREAARPTGEAPVTPITCYSTALFSMIIFNGTGMEPGNDNFSGNQSWTYLY